MSTPSDTFRIIHASDPHFGRSFHVTMWEQFCHIAIELQPHLLILTGDCVNTPWRWVLNRAKRAIDELETELNTSRPPGECCYIRMTPGNHDVRFFGLIPAEMTIFIPGIAVILIMLTFFAWTWGWIEAFPAGLTVAGFTLALTGLHHVCIARYADIFRDRLGTTPEQFRVGHIELDLYHFDSASRSIWSAEGFVRTKDFANAAHHPVPVDSALPAASHTDTSDPAPAPAATPHEPALRLTYRMAITHHHPVGIPHDHEYENLMVLRNAGALLSELTAQQIRLVLHGHRHHPHFSRVTVYANQPHAFNIGILSAGTVSRGKKAPEKYDYQFYALNLDANLNMQATPYVSEGGSFQPRPSFYIEDLHEAVRRQRAFAQQSYGITTDHLVSRTRIYPDGDTFERMEYYGFRVADPAQHLAELPRPPHAIVDRGHIERFSAGPLDAHCPPALFLQPDPHRYTLREQHGHLRFGTTVYAQSQPFSFFVQFHALNSLAMSIQQHQERYGHTPQPRTETTTLTTPVWPINRLDLLVEFPTGFQLHGAPELTIENPHSQRLNLLEDEYRQLLAHDPNTNTVRLTVNTPPPDTSFTIRWRLRDEEPPEARAITRLSGATKQLQRTLLDLAWGPVRDGQRPGLNSRVWDLMHAIALHLEDIVRDQLQIGAPGHDPLEVTLTIYDTMTGLLRNIGGNYPATDDRATHTFEFGDGIVGRSFKTNAMRLFVKAMSDTSSAPYGYLPWPTFPLPAGIPHDVLFCLPLTNPEAQSLIYGILTVGSRRADSRLLTLQEADTHEQRLKHKAFYTLLNTVCFQALFQFIADPSLTKPRTPDTLTS